MISKLLIRSGVCLTSTFSLHVIFLFLFRFYHRLTDESTNNRWHRLIGWLRLYEDADTEDASL